MEKEKITKEEKQRILEALPAINGSIPAEISDLLYRIEGNIIRGGFGKDEYSSLAALFSYCNWPIHDGFPFEFRKEIQQYCNPKHISKEKIEIWLSQY